MIQKIFLLYENHCNNKIKTSKTFEDREERTVCFWCFWAGRAASTTSSPANYEHSGVEEELLPLKTRKP